MLTDTTTQFFLGETLLAPTTLAFASGTILVHTEACRHRSDTNQDAAALIRQDDDTGVIVLADGFGGQPAGDRAAQIAVSSVIESVDRQTANGADAQVGIMAGFDEANLAVQALGIGAATTLAVAHIDGSRVRPYHVGDSEILVVGQRGRHKFQTISHSPVGYGVEAGVLEPNEAMHHEQRHIVSNMVGSAEMRIDVGPSIELNARDTLLVASDGLFDNLMIDEIVELIRKGDLLQQGQKLVERCHEQMYEAAAGPSKPDDLTVVLYRPAVARNHAATVSTSGRNAIDTPTP